MKNTGYGILLAIFFLWSSHQKIQAQLWKKDAFLKHLKKMEGKGAYSGQFIRWNHNASLDEIKTIHDSASQWVSILGIDYFSNKKELIPAAPANYLLVNAVVTSYFKKGGIVNLSCHFNNPQNGRSAWDTKIDFDSLLMKGSRVEANYLHQLDTVAVGMKNLIASNVLVIFRPLHEMSGDWFWWCGQKRYTELWLLTYRYLEETKGIKDLVWCYSPSTMGNVLAYYPGNAFVDIVALDAYTADLKKVAFAQYQSLLSIGKPFGFGEYGPWDGNVASTQAQYDFQLFGKALKTDFPKAVFFLTWRDHWGMAKNKGIAAFLNDKWVKNANPKDMKQ